MWQSFHLKKSERAWKMHILTKHLHVFAKRFIFANECFIQIHAHDFAATHHQNNWTKFMVWQTENSE